MSLFDAEDFVDEQNDILNELYNVNGEFDRPIRYTLKKGLFFDKVGDLYGTTGTFSKDNDGEINLTTKKYYKNPRYELNYNGKRLRNGLAGAGLAYATYRLGRKLYNKFKRSNNPQS